MGSYFLKVATNAETSQESCLGGNARIISNWQIYNKEADAAAQQRTSFDSL